MSGVSRVTAGAKVVGPTGFAVGVGVRRARYSKDMSAEPGAVPVTAVGQPRVPADHPGVLDLFGVLAYGEISAFYRLAEEAKLAPTLQGRVAVAEMGAAEMGHFETLRKALAARGVDVFTAMSPFVHAIDDYHSSTDPSTWLESMVKFYVGDGIAADFYAELADALEPEVGAVVHDVLSQTSHSQFVVAEVGSSVAASRSQRDRLTLWGRRLLGEAVTQAQCVMAQRDELTELVLTAAGDLNGIAELFQRLQTRHAERMRTLGIG